MRWDRRRVTASDRPRGGGWMGHVLDNPVWGALTGAHAGLAERRGRAARYQADVAPFAAVEDPADPGCWADLDALTGPGGTAVLPLFGAGAPPPGWQVVNQIVGVQLLAPAE